MSESTKIEWCDSTFNPWFGCTKVSPACTHCYAEGWAKRSGLVKWGPTAERRRASVAKWREPVRWNAEHESFFAEHGRRRRVFCASLADVFEDRPELKPWRDDLFRLIIETPHLDWLLLTKRPENIVDLTRPAAYGLRNVWIGTTVENQEYADKRIPHLIEARNRIGWRIAFLSVEPMLGAVTLSHTWTTTDGSREYSWLGNLHGGANRSYGAHGVDLVICGGESGPGARPMHPNWARSLRDQCAAAGVAFHFKQWGEFVTAGHPEFGRLPERQIEGMRSDGTLWAEWPDDEDADCLTVHRVGKARAGRLLDGIEHNEYPAAMPDRRPHSAE